MSERNTMIGIDPRMFDLAGSATRDHQLFRVDEIPLVDAEFFVYAANRTAVEEIVGERAVMLNLPLIWREIEAL